MNVGFSIHQKFVVLDSGDTVTAFFGGLDLTKGRFDWSDHPIDYPGPTGPLGGRSFDKDHRTYDDFYNAEFTTAQTDWWDQHAWVADSAEPGDTTMPRQPWQDYYARIAGPSAWDIVRELVGRWNVFNREMSSGDDGNNDRKRVENLFLRLFSSGSVKPPWHDHGGPFTARVVRSVVAADWGPRRDHTVVSVSDPIPCDTPTANGATQTEFTWSLPGKERFEHSIEQERRQKKASPNEQAVHDLRAQQGHDLRRRLSHPRQREPQRV